MHLLAWRLRYYHQGAGPGYCGSCFSALMSTASGTLLASSTLISNDIIKRFFKKDVTDKQYLKLSRIVTTVIGILTIVCALWIQDVLVALDVAYAVLSGGIFAPVILGLFWKRATGKAAFYAIIASFNRDTGRPCHSRNYSNDADYLWYCCQLCRHDCCSLATKQSDELNIAS